MAFKRYKYETDAGNVIRIRLTPEIAAFAGAEPAGAVDQFNLFASVGGSKRRQTALKARAHIFANEETTTSGRKAIRYLRVPKLTQEAYNTFPTAKITVNEIEFEFVNRDGEG